MEKKKELIPEHVFQAINHEVNLPNFLENEIGCDLKWRDDDYASCICPMPDHKDDKPSFNMKKTDEGVWIYHCFGCGTKGTIIHFCKDYYGYNLYEAVLFIREKFKLGDLNRLENIVGGLKKNINYKKKIECAHVSSCKICFSLLKKDFKKYSQWVSQAYKKMNDALDRDDLEAVEDIGYEASAKIGG